MKKSIVLSVFLFLLIFNALDLKAEQEPDVRDLSVRERIFVGGSVGLQFGTITSINVSPIVGYRITNRFSSGIGGIYQYFNDRSFGQSYSTHVYGGSVFARFRVVSQAFLHAEYERVSLESYTFGDVEDVARIWENNYFLGGGYRLRLGERSWFNIMVLYNFNQESEVYHQNPQFRFGIDVGL